MRKLTLEQIIERLKTLNPTVTILSTEYGGCKTKLKCFCNIHKIVWYTNYSTLAKGCGCSKCSSEKIGNALRKDFDQFKKELEEISPHILILSEKYEEAHSKLDCVCITHNVKWQTTPNTLLRGSGCPTCSSIGKANGRRLSFEEVENRIATLSPNLTLVSDNYIKAKTKLKLHCNVCGNDFEMRFDNISQGQNCPKCSLRLMSGDNSSLWKGGITVLSQYARGGLFTWKTDTEKANNYKCVITGDPYDDVHHIVGFNIIFDEALSICKLPIYPEIGYYTMEELLYLRKISLELHYKYGLGACLTEDVHKEFHRIYGYGDNTYEQFEEFKKNYKVS